MSALSRLGLVIVVAAAVLMFLPGPSALGAAHPALAISPAGLSAASAASPAPAVGSPSAASVNAHEATVDRMRAALTADGIPAREQLLPSADPGVTVQNGMISPGSVLASNPTGIADYGIQEHHGVNVASISYTPSVEGVLNLTQLNLLYMDSYGTDEFTAQLNSVAVNVAVQQNTSYQFWTQNVIYYYQSDHMLHLADAIVNFSSPALTVPYGAILGGHGYMAAGFGYFYPTGPAIYAPEPFTIAFFNNLTVVDNRPALYFNYSVTSPAGVSAGSYDMVEFNSTFPVAPVPTYQIDGVAVGDTGYIPNDVELDLVGDGGGSATTALNVAGTMNLYTQPNGTSYYVPIPAAWNFGSETGETSEGIGEWASGPWNPTAHLGPGPSVLQALWGVAGAPRFGERTITLDVTPASAFVFASIGATFDPNTADWAPVPPSGVASYQLPAGRYSFEVLLSEYSPVWLNSTWPGTHTVTLASDPSLGIYTPLWANTNSELPGISQGGAGTVSDPYVLFNGPWESLNPLFGQYNDYMFPVFPGLLLANTNAYVTVYHESPFEVAYTLTSEQFYSAVLPLDNELGYALYNASYVSIVSTPSIGGWFSVFVYGAADLILWNSTHNLIAGNGFQVSGPGIFAFGGHTNLFWGNVLTESLPIAPDPGYVLDYGNAISLELYESHDLIYNNVFATPNTAFTPPYNIYDFFYIPELWTDQWNVYKQPATDVRTFNGWELSGNILGLSYEGGNWWSNYGTQSDPYGILPYNNGGNIVVGGDHVPLLTFSLYKVTFRETGLPSGTWWSVTLNGITESTNQTSLPFWDPNGTYAYTVGAISGYTAHPSIGAIVVNGANRAVKITWT